MTEHNVEHNQKNKQDDGNNAKTYEDFNHVVPHAVTAFWNKCGKTYLFSNIRDLVQLSNQVLLHERNLHNYKAALC